MNYSANIHKIALIFLVFSLGLWTGAATGAEATYPNESKVNKAVEIDITIPEVFSGIVKLRGTAQLEWSDPILQPDGTYDVEMEMVELDIRGYDPDLGEIKVILNPEIPTYGLCEDLDPEPFMVESFFDVFMYVIIPDGLPGDTLYNNVPLHLDAVINDIPPYFDEYVSAGPVPLMSWVTGLEMGTVNSWAGDMIPWSDPDVYTFVQTNGDVAVAEDGVVQIQAQLSGNLEIIQADFGIRPLGDAGPFTNFYTDLDGTEPKRSTTGPLGTGGGWSGYLDLSAWVGTEGGYLEIETELTDIFSGIWRDTVEIYGDLSDIIPEIQESEEDTAFIVCPPDSEKNIVYSVADEDAANGYLLVYKISDYSRSIVCIDQFGLGTNYDDAACGPTSAASCLKYWADNGYPELEHPKGDTNKPAQKPEDTARELGESMGTDSTGTSDSDIESGIEDYLGEHGCDGWSVDREYGGADGYKSLMRILEEFYANGEDVILLLSDTTSSGGGGGGVDTIGHAVTMGSFEAGVEVGFLPPSVDFKSKIDFMDPSGGDSTSNNNYDVDIDSSDVALNGYSLSGSASSARIDGFIKVSPPEDAEASGALASGALAGGALAGVMGRRVVSSPAFVDGAWNQADSGSVKGNGALDTLTWNTTGYPTGAYLMQVVAEDAGGISGRDLRLCVIPDYTTGTEDPDTPRGRSHLRRNYPNPFNPVTNIEFEVAKKSKVTITVYDITGRRVKKLIDEKVFQPGVHRVRWDALNSGGKRVASGVYFCRMTAPGSESVVKVILLR